MRLVKKKDRSTRMVHNFVPINKATIHSNYPMRRMESIVNALAKENKRYFFSADAYNGYYAITIYPPHAYKTAFGTVLSWYC